MPRIATMRSSDLISQSAIRFLILSHLLFLVEATAFKKHDGLHRAEKKPQITQPAVLGLRRRDDNVCGVRMTLCPSSLGGGCCPDNYECAKESCYATTKGPSTCGTKIGWYACAAVYGGGCCPDGYLCERAANCVPPSGTPFTFGCPSNHYLCPSSASYGCCPNGMGCAVDQCYSTDPITVTSTLIITSTFSGSAVAYTTTATAISSPSPPTAFPTLTSDDSDQRVLKYFPSAIAQVKPPEKPANNGGGGISAAQLGGIVTGSISFVIIALVAVFLVFRRCSAQHRRSSVSTRSGESKRFDEMKARSQLIQVRPLASEADSRSGDPLMMASPPPSHPRSSPSLDFLAGGSPELSGSARDTPSSFGGEFQSMGSNASRHGSVEHDGTVATLGYFDSLPGMSQHSPEQPSGFARAMSHMSRNGRPQYSHVRQYSDVSSTSSGPDTIIAELETEPYHAELPTSPPGVISPMDERQRARASSGIWPSGRAPVIHRRERSDGPSATRLDVVDEELIHGYHGPIDRVAGQTATDKLESREC